jgi:integrase
MTIMPRPRWPHLHREFNRHGRPVWYVRAGKGPRTRIHAEFGTDEFEAAYHAAVRGETHVPRGKSRVGTFAWLIDRYRESAAWANLSQATRRQRENIFKGVIKTAGHESFTHIDRKTIVAGRDRRRDAANAARHFVQTMRGLFQWAVEAEHVRADPTLGIRSMRPATDGFHVWTEDECKKFEKRWPTGTRERLAYDVLLYTGLRRGDAVRLGRPHVKDGEMTIRTEKTGELVVIPILPPLAASIAAAPVGDLTFIATASGKPWRKESFGNWFRGACQKAGVPGAAHGLRKAGATRAANNGATVAQLEAIFGWRGGRMASLYTRQADRKRLAEAGAAMLLDEKENIYSRTHAESAGETGQKIRKIK